MFSVSNWGKVFEGSVLGSHGENAGEPTAEMPSVVGHTGVYRRWASLPVEGASQNPGGLDVFHRAIQNLLGASDLGFWWFTPVSEAPRAMAAGSGAPCGFEPECGFEFTSADRVAQVQGAQAVSRSP